MAVYRFRVAIDGEEEVIRDIEVRSNRGFATLHGAVVQFFNFRQDQEAEYYTADQSWYEEDKVAVLKPGGEDTKKLADFIYDPHQRFICITESFNEVALTLELMKVSKEVEGVKYPSLAKSEGEPPHFTQPPLSHIPDEEGEATIDMTEDITVDGPEEEPQLEAPSSAGDGEDIEMPDFSEFLKGVMDDADDMLKEATSDEKATQEPKKEEDKKPAKGADEPSDFNVNDLM